jgi:pimeloyl-ACP methyl ester carboxylesterase
MIWQNGACSWLAPARSGRAPQGFGRERRAAVHARAAPAGRREHPTVELSAFVPNRLKQLSPEGLPLVVVLHGLLGNSNNWRSMLTRPDCCPGMYTVSLDLRNHGKSGWAKTNTFAEMSDDVLDFAGTLPKPSLHPGVNSKENWTFYWVNFQGNALKSQCTPLKIYPGKGPICL